LSSPPHFFVAEKPELFVIETKRGTFQAACFPWPTRHVLLTKEEYKNLLDEEITRTITEKSVSRIKKFTRDADPDLPLVLVAHLALAEATYSGSEQSTMIGTDPVILKSDLIDPTFDYVALGHIHKHQDMNPKSQPHVVYPGSLERIDFGEANEEKGFCLVSLHKGDTSYEFIQTPARQFVKVEVDLREQDFPTEAILRKLTAMDFHDAVVRVAYMINEEQKNQIDIRKIYAALESAFLVAGVTQRTQEIHTQRPRLAEDLSLEDALAQYLEFKPELASMKDDLLEYGKKLIRDLQVFE
jgi:exonuclease SbcD